MSPLPEVTIGNTEPLYNIGVVTRMTGVSMATLRAWERRYNFPESERTAGGHRLYSERDVLQLRWVKERIQDGMQTAQAINALRHQESTGRLVQSVQANATYDTLSDGTGIHLEILQRQLFDALIHRDFQAADGVLGESLAASTVEDLILHVIGPTFEQIGEAWEAGKINVADEHLSTNYLRQKLLMWMVSSPPSKPVHPIILACAPNEWHEGGLLILAALLRRRRWPITYLGQATPLNDLASFIRDLHPALVVLSATTETSATELIDWPRWLPEAAQTGSPIIGYGGRIFVSQPEWRLRIAGTYLGDDLDEAIDNIERML